MIFLGILTAVVTALALVLSALRYALRRWWYWGEPRLALEHEIVLVTGASNGVGRCLVNKLVAFAPHVKVVAVDCEPLPVDAQWAGQADPSSKDRLVYFYQEDLATVDIDDLLSRVERDVGAIPTALINNAGTVVGAYLTDLGPDQVQHTLRVNLVAPMLLTRALLRRAWIKRNHGHVVHVASAAGLTGLAWLTDYCASKWGLIGFHESLRQELRHTRVKSSIICPGHIKTRLFASVKPVAPWLMPTLEPDDVAARIVAILEINQPQDVWVPVFTWSALIVRIVPIWLNDFGHWIMGANDFHPEHKGPKYAQNLSSLYKRMQQAHEEAQQASS